MLKVKLEIQIELKITWTTQTYDNITVILCMNLQYRKCDNDPLSFFGTQELSQIENCR